MSELNLKDIWDGDLLDRKREATMLMGYIESIYSRSLNGERAGSMTVAVDAGYGAGKTYFLSRFKRQAGVNHPVAFVDAWRDDLSDEPLTAVAATLKAALDPLIKVQPSVASRWDVFLEKAGKVAQISSVGLLKRAAALLLTAGAVNGLTEVLENAPEAVGDAIEDAIKDASKDAADAGGQIISSIGVARTMRARVEEFEAGQAAIEEMKNSLAAVVELLPLQQLQAPIIIIIDELDRCRPTYAVKLLEEVKHLFDVPGLVFIFGLHGDQLAHSITGAYGANFDGASYLRRFFNRRYSLASASLRPVLKSYFSSAGLKESDFVYWPLFEVSGNRVDDPAEICALIMESHKLTARDALEFTDIMQTCVALSSPSQVVLPYLSEMLCVYMRNIPSFNAYIPEQYPRWSYRRYDGRSISQKESYEAFRNFSSMSRSEVTKEFNRNNDNPFAEITFEVSQKNAAGFGPISEYDRLVGAVGRFKQPNAEV